MKVLITGATGGFGSLLIKRLENEPNVSKIIGLSNEDLDEGIEDYIEEEKFEFYMGDTRKKRVEEVFLRNRNIDAIVHLAFDVTPGHAVDQAEETNVFGTQRMILMARKYGVKKFILKSPTAVYGARPDNPSLLKEDAPLRGNRADETLRNKIEADMTCQMNMHPGILPNVVILRFCGILGDNVRSPLNTLLGGPLVPTVLGFDPLFQVIHEDDVIEALACAVLSEHANGIYNVAGKFTEPLSEVIHRLGKTSVPLPEGLLSLGYRGYFLARRRHSFPFDLSFLKHTFVVDDTRIRKELGFEPKVL